MTHLFMFNENPCVVCAVEIRPRQESLCCDGYNKWQHRICNSGITRDIYRQINRGEIGEIQWNYVTNQMRQNKTSCYVTLLS